MDEEIEMEREAATPPMSGPTPFQLQFDKPIPSQIKIAEWNPEKDLLAMVTEDAKVFLHRFNWQRLWTLSPGKHITSLCWRPDGKAIALGLEDGSILLHDVENGKLLRSLKSHAVAVVCLNWEEDAQLTRDEDDIFNFEDRAARFFPPAPRIPRMPGLSSGDPGLTEDPDDSLQELSNSERLRFNILCSGDKDGCICFSIFGIFPIGKINIHDLSYDTLGQKTASHKLLNASICKVSLSKDLCQLIVLSFGELIEDSMSSGSNPLGKHGTTNLSESLHEDSTSTGLFCLLLDTSMFLNRKNELHQVVQQASNIDDLVDVVRASFSVMSKQWSDAMHVFHDKFDSLSSLIIDYGLDSSSQEEFLSLLFGARISPALHQFLVNSLGEAGLKRVSKAVDNAGRELHLVATEHLQPSVEIIGFRIGELRGLSRWRSRYQGIGLDECLIHNATEKAGMLLVQVERFLRVLAIVMYQFHNFFTWVLKCIKLLLSEPTDQIQPPNSELVVIFLNFLLNHDPIGQLLDTYDVKHTMQVELTTIQRVEQLIAFGGFLDSRFLERSLVMEFSLLEKCFKEAFLMPFTTISRAIHCKSVLSLYPLPNSLPLTMFSSPASIMYHQDAISTAGRHQHQHQCLDYICFKIPEESLDSPNCIGILRGFTKNFNSAEEGASSFDAALLFIPNGFLCVDLSLYKDSQIVLLFKELTSASEGSERSWLMMIEIKNLSFASLPSSLISAFWKMPLVKASAVELHLGYGKARCIPHSVTAPLAVSASRGTACIFGSRRHALVYILDEDEYDSSESE